MIKYKDVGNEDGMDQEINYHNQANDTEFNSTKINKGVCKMAQQVKVLATQSDHLNSMHRIHMVEGQNQLLQVAQVQV